jgi:hypothetical protein
VSTKTIGVYCSISLNDAPRNAYTLIKSIKNIRFFKQEASRCTRKMASAGFHSIAKFRAPIPNPIIVDRGVYSADCHSENGRTADCQSQKS